MSSNPVSYKPLSSWNTILDWTTGNLVRGTTICLPRSIKSLITTRYFTQAKALTHGLATVVCLQGTIGNPWINKSVAFAIGGLSIASTIGLAWSYQKTHFSELAILPVKKMVAAVSLPLFFAIAKSALLYNLNEASNSDFFNSFSVSIWTTYVAIFATIISHSVLLESTKQNQRQEESIVEIPSMDPNSLLGKVANQARLYKKAISELQVKIKKLDGFILNNPELKETAFEALKNYQLVYANYIPTSTEDFDPSNPIDHMTLLGLEKDALSRDLEERIVFIQRNRTVYECFKKHMTSPSGTSSTSSMLIIQTAHW